MKCKTAALSSLPPGEKPHAQQTASQPPPSDQRSHNPLLCSAAKTPTAEAEDVFPEPSKPLGPWTQEPSQHALWEWPKRTAHGSEQPHQAPHSSTMLPLRTTVPHTSGLVRATCARLKGGPSVASALATGAKTWAAQRATFPKPEDASLTASWVAECSGPAASMPSVGTFVLAIVHSQPEGALR